MNIYTAKGGCYTATVCKTNKAYVVDVRRNTDNTMIDSVPSTTLDTAKYIADSKAAMIADIFRHIWSSESYGYAKYMVFHNVGQNNYVIRYYYKARHLPSHDLIRTTSSIAITEAKALLARLSR